MTELTKAIRQKENQTFIEFLNNVRVGQWFKGNTKKLQLKKIDINNASPDLTLIFAENQPTGNYNECKLIHLNYFKITV